MIQIKFVDEVYSKYRLGKTIKYKSFKEILNLKNFNEIRFILCQYCNLSSEDIKILPKKLLVLDCEWNDITNFKELPKKLKILRCRNNKLKNIPKLPDSIIIFECDEYLQEIENFKDKINITKINTTKKYITRKYYEIYKLPKISDIMELEDL